MTILNGFWSEIIHICCTYTYNNKNKLFVFVFRILDFVNLSIFYRVRQKL